MDGYVKPKCINNLSPEILTLIFSFYGDYVGNGKVCSVLANVSTLWKKVSLNCSLWRNVYFTANDFEHGCSWLKDEEVLAQFSFVKTLNFKCDERITQSTRQALKIILKNSSGLEAFNLEWNDEFQFPCFITNLSALCPKISAIRIKSGNLFRSMLLKCIKSCGANLTSLSLCDIYLNNFSLTWLSHAIVEHCPNITHLELHDISCTEGGLDLTVLQAGYPELRELSLKGLRLADNDDLTPGFLQLKKLCFKPLVVRHYDSKLQQTILKILRGSRKLEELELLDVNPSSKTILQLPCTSLKKLRFPYYSPLASGLHDILHHWRHSLITLDISCCYKAQQVLFQYLEENKATALKSLTVCCFSENVKTFFV